MNANDNGVLGGGCMCLFAFCLFTFFFFLFSSAKNDIKMVEKNGGFPPKVVFKHTWLLLRIGFDLYSGSF